MLRTRSLALAAVATMAMHSAHAANFTVDFENAWSYNLGDVNDHYNGGTAADGSSGANLGVSFVNISGLSNDAAFTYYANAPSMQGTAYAHTFAPEDRALMNVAAGVDGTLSLYFSTPENAPGAIKAYDGLNGTGNLLGTLDLTANSSSSYDTWTAITFNFGGKARSFDFTGSANLVGIDNVSAVPLPPAAGLFAAGLLGLAGQRRKRA